MVVATLDVLDVLKSVMDPEIPAVSIVDLGMIDDVTVDGSHVTVTCLPTFVGCPAIEMIQRDISTALTSAGWVPEVVISFKTPWTTDRITDEGRGKLREYGLAPPDREQVPLSILTSGGCPYCGSSDTVLESPFGPTPCRATCYCRSCRNPFEKFKEL